MPTQVRLPRLSQATTEAIVVRWLVDEGEPVCAGEPLLEVESDKATVEIEAPTTGTLLQIFAGPDDTVVVGGVLAVIGARGESALPHTGTHPREEGTGGLLPTAGPPRRLHPTRGRPPATPAARKLARELDIELASIDGTGPGGVITPHDVRMHDVRVHAAARPSVPSGGGGEPGGEAVFQPALPEIEVVPLRGVQKRMAEKIRESHRSQAAVTTVAEVDLSTVQALRLQQAATYTSFVVRAAALALRDYPLLNASLQGDRVYRYRRIHVSVALDTEFGLLVPVIRDADCKSLAQVNAEIERLAGQGRQGSLRPEQMEGGTFTVTNSGVLGSLLFTPALNYPQGATLGMGKLEMRPVVLGEEIVARPMMYLSLTYDHRFIDGATAVRFLQQVKKNLEQPNALLTASEAGPQG